MRDSFGSVIRRRGIIAASLVASALYLFPSTAHAELSAAHKIYAEKLKDSNSSVRASAAISLGSANDDDAVQPLCGALNDGDETVRIAASASLKKLGARPGSLDCLNARQSVEPSDAVKVAITRAIETISNAGGGGGAISINPNAKYYVLLSNVANTTARKSEVEQIILKSMKAKLDAAGTMQLAPSNESPDKARSVMKDRKLKGGFYLAIAVENQYADGNLKVKIKIGVFNYPNKSLLGNVDKSLTAQGVSSGDTSSENRLYDLAAGLAADQFAQNASAFL